MLYVCSLGYEELFPASQIWSEKAVWRAVDFIQVRKIYIKCLGLLGQVVYLMCKLSAGGLNFPDKQVDLGCWLRFGFEFPWWRLVVSLFQDPIYGHYMCPAWIEG